ncbi:5-methylthioadenosine/S-adenosylhomocysteine deaminase [Streptomyces sp. SAI-117]|uniref:amidohydrolase family protein n=1 Tax=unclassified Streptomyces TaxID=2593676 RepID=UPI002476EE42|nr:MULTISPECIES: amidohydrolase family protein [unclassified Streptomyces]MDH6554032.1 5-methylthioadenosine/S-adenosylhomocysteine deaminase [Streptomyces sp. SAI-041]MDH6573108.1 5-methylthioadenosine/S-adenosylhomocysteine deaminase [Streptomyces sp. SAI-117]
MSRILLRGAHVITMTPDRPDAEQVDILIDGDTIAAVGETVEAPDAEVVDFSGRVIIPGLVNAHLHTWQTALRSAGADWTLMEYLTHLHGECVGQYTPADMHISNLAGALNQINCGTTTVGDWCHNALSPEHADAAVEGLVQAGIRAVFLHGTPYRSPDTPHPLAEIDRLLDGPVRDHALLTLGMALQGPQYSSVETALADFRAGAERGLVVSMHQSGGEPSPGWEAVRNAGLFSPLTNVVHGADLPDDWIKTLVEAGVTFTTTPENELGQGHGTPVTGSLLSLGAAPSLGTDIDTVVPGRVLTAARIALAHQRSLDHAHHRQTTGTYANTPSVTGKQALAWATVEGAKALGLADKVGRIEAGMQADLVAVDARALNLWPAHDPVATVLHADIANIEAVMVAGTWRKRDHVLLASGLDEVRDQLCESGERLLRGIRPAGSPG